MNTLQKLAQMINENWPDLAQDEDSVQYEMLKAIAQNGKPLVTYCADVARIMTQDDTRFITMWTPVLATINAQLPSGSGFDSGSEFLPDDSTKSRLVFKTAFHHMTEHGYYDGWTEHFVIVTPSFNGFDIRATGRNRNDIKEYIADCFHSILSEQWRANFAFGTMDIVK